MRPFDTIFAIGCALVLGAFIGGWFSGGEHVKRLLSGDPSSDRCRLVVEP